MEFFKTEWKPLLIAATAVAATYLLLLAVRLPGSAIITAAVLLMWVTWIAVTFARKRPCADCGSLTLNAPDGSPLCGRCQDRRAMQSLQAEAEATEPQVFCSCGHVMRKQVERLSSGLIVVDICPRDRSVQLTSSELQQILAEVDRTAYQKGRRDGHDSLFPARLLGFGIGFVLGVVLLINSGIIEWILSRI